MNTLTHQPANLEAPHLAQERHINAGLVLANLVEVNQSPEGVFRSIEPGPDLALPLNYVDRKPQMHTVASQHVESLRGNQALLVDLAPTNKDLNQLFEAAQRSRKGAENRLSRMTYEGLARILDTPGDRGLHHVHGSRFPRTVYFNCTGGSGTVLGVYLTNLGKEDSTGLPVYGRITASKDKRSEYEVFRTIGAANQKKRYNP